MISSTGSGRSAVMAASMMLELAVVHLRIRPPDVDRRERLVLHELEQRVLGELEDGEKVTTTPIRPPSR
jgi:hypothetical protein